MAAPAVQTQKVANSNKMQDIPGTECKLPLKPTFKQELAFMNCRQEEMDTANEDRLRAASSANTTYPNYTEKHFLERYNTVGRSTGRPYDYSSDY